MLKRLREIWYGLKTRRELSRWQALTDRAKDMPRTELRRWRARARHLGRTLDRFVAKADDRLADPAIGSEFMRKPKLSDWAFRPIPWRLPVRPHGLANVDSGTNICDGVSIHHDSPGNNLIFRQNRSTETDDLAPFSVSIETLWAEGNFLSLSIDIPENVALTLRRRHILRVDVSWELEHPVEGFVRLNIRHGPNTDQILRGLSREKRESCVEFDLAYSSVNEKRVDHAWIDLIFENPGFNRIKIGDVAMTRRQRAEV